MASTSVRAARTAANISVSARNALRESSAAVRRSSAAGDDRVFDSHQASASSTSSGRSWSSIWVMSSAGGCATTINLESVGGGGDNRAGVAGEGFVDHLALEGDRGLALGHRSVVRDEEATGTVELLR